MVSKNTTDKKKNQSIGKVIQVLGPVVDVKFSENNIPKIYDALIVDNNGKKLVLEVEQNIGDEIVRTIAMGPTEGLKED